MSNPLIHLYVPCHNQQLARERWGGQDTLLIGFGSAEGTVMAGKHWGAPMEVMPLPEAKPGTWEDVCRRASKVRFVCVGRMVVDRQTRHARVLTAARHFNSGAQHAGAARHAKAQ